jgi:hypothetical protein
LLKFWSFLSPSFEAMVVDSHIYANYQLHLLTLNICIKMPIGMKTLPIVLQWNTQPIHGFDVSGYVNYHLICHLIWFWNLLRNHGCCSCILYMNYQCIIDFECFCKEGCRYGYLLHGETLTIVLHWLHSIVVDIGFYMMPSTPIDFEGLIVKMNP